MPDGPEQFDRNWLRRLRRNLKCWYRKHARDLPWRRTTDPYLVWISEIMLQQTTVATVVPYYQRFLKRFPTVQEVAAASQQEVLKLWEGLGYYSRARNIHKTAKLIVDDNQGQFPDEVQVLLKLPGIGRYTAGAIASFAFDVRAPIVEANTLRLYCRLMGYRGDPRSSKGQHRLWQFAKYILPRHSPGLFNQALMELGSTVCTPLDPVCSTCPMRSCCVAHADGIEAEIPRPATHAAITQVTEATVAVAKEDAYLLMRRGERERWAGLWDFPRFPIDVGQMDLRFSSETKKRSRLSPLLRNRLQERLYRKFGVQVEIGGLLTQIRHSVTRYRITLLCFQGQFISAIGEGDSKDIRWVRLQDFADLPLSVTGRRLANLLTKTQSPTKA